MIGSRGSIIETLLRDRKAKKVKVTDIEMTRFWISLEETFKLCMFALSEMVGGEIFIPKPASMRLVDLFNALAPQAKQEVIGIRPGEKIHEMLLTESEARHSVDYKDYFVILADFAHLWSSNLYKKYHKNGTALSPNYSFVSCNNPKWLTIKDMIDLIKSDSSKHEYSIEK